MTAKVKNSDITQDAPLQINFESKEPEGIKLEIEIYLT